MSFLRNNDVKKHLARAVPRSMTPATEGHVPDAEAAAVQPVEEGIAGSVSAVVGSVTAEAPEKIRPM